MLEMTDEDRAAFDAANASIGYEPGGPRISRPEDMSYAGRLELHLDNNGDVTVTIIPDPARRDGGPVFTSVEFCASGGQSFHTRKALRFLAVAMRRDNIERPLSR